MSTILVIGGSSGIGKQLSENLATKGNKVYATFLSNDVKSELDSLSYHRLNVQDPEPGLEFLPETIDHLVYCPGTINLRPFSRIRPEDFSRDFDLQVVGAVRMIQLVLNKLKTGNNPSVLLFSTVAVQTGMAFHSLVATSKGAVEGLTRALAAELAPTIRVNCIAPSLTDTPLAAGLLNTPEKRTANAQRHPLKKIGTSNDIAAMAEFLLSDAAGWITGQIFHVDGGMSALRAIS